MSLINRDEPVLFIGIAGFPSVDTVGFESVEDGVGFGLFESMLEVELAAKEDRDGSEGGQDTKERAYFGGVRVQESRGGCGGRVHGRASCACDECSAPYRQDQQRPLGVMYGHHNAILWRSDQPPERVLWVKRACFT